MDLSYEPERHVKFDIELGIFYGKIKAKLIFVLRFVEA